MLAASLTKKVRHDAVNRRLKKERHFPRFFKARLYQHRVRRENAQHLSMPR